MLKDLFSLLTIIALLFSSCSKSDEEENGDEPQPTKQTAYFGVNLSGAEFGNVYPGVDGTHYGYPTEKDLDYFKAKGLYLVRFPFRWERIQPTMNGELNATELAKMKKFVKAAEDRNIQILLDMHNFVYIATGKVHKIINMQSLVMHDALLTISVTYGKNWQRSLKTIKISGVTTL